MKKWERFKNKRRSKASQEDAMRAAEIQHLEARELLAKERALKFKKGTSETISRKLRERENSFVREGVQ